MKTWLETFANRIEIHAGYFVIAFLFSLNVAAVTVSFQAMKAAIANQVKSLRIE